MPIERPAPGRRSAARLGPAFRRHRQRVAASAASGLGAALCGYGAMLAINLGPDETPEPAPTPTEAAVSKQFSAPDMLGAGDRAVPISADAALALHPGDRVELVSILPGPTGNTADVLATARVIDVDSDTVIVAVDQETMVAILGVQANGEVRLVGLP